MPAEPTRLRRRHRPTRRRGLDSTTGGLVHIDRLDVGRYEIPVKGAPTGADDGKAMVTATSTAARCSATPGPGGGEGPGELPRHHRQPVESAFTFHWTGRFTA
jgi:hypothetical protein